MKDSMRVFAALIAGLVTGAALSLARADVTTPILSILAPLGALWVNALRMTTIPLIVALVITGITSNANSAVGRLGVRTVSVFVGLSLYMAAVAIPIIAFAFSAIDMKSGQGLPSGVAEAAQSVRLEQQSPSLGGWLVSLVPANPVAAAANGAMLPLVVFAVLFAIALTRVSEPARKSVVEFFAGVGDAMFVLVRWVLWLAPAGVFALVVPLAARAGNGLAGAIGWYIAIYSAGCVFGVLLLLIAVRIMTQFSNATYARALLPGQLIAFSSSSSMAALPALAQGADDLGINSQVRGFVLPLAVATFKVAAPVSWTCGTLFVSHYYGVPLGLSGLLTIALAAVFFGFGVPGIPRGAFLMLAPLFASLRLPVEGIGILIAVDAIPDTFATILNASGYFAATAIAAQRSTTDSSLRSK